MSLPSQPDEQKFLQALQECAREPIHTPGSVQSCGVVFAVSEDGLVTQCGGGGEELVGASAAALVGRSLSQIFGTDDAARIQTAFAGLPPDVVRRVGFVSATGGAGPPLEASVHVRDGVRLLEVIVSEPAATDPLGLIDTIGDAVDDLTARLVRDEPLLSFAQVVVERLRGLTGYDRVMVYRFDPEWNGEVIASARRADSEPYVGLWYPASDIPPQARALYLLNPVRVFADVGADPLPLHPRVNPTTGRELDLSLATLRAMSPVHREYLQNMGVGATLVASVVKDGRLWGLIACHHDRRRVPSPLVRRLIESVARLLSSRVTLGETRDRTAGVLAAQTLLKRLPTAFTAAAEVEAALVAPEAGLMELLAADGVAVAHRGRTWDRGEVPAAADLVRLVGWLEARGDRLFATAALGAEAPEFAGLAAVASGLLAVRFPNASPGWVLWFRGEAAGSVRWAGDPRKGLVASDAPRLSPRKSFEAWVEAVRGRSRPWTPAEVALVDEAVRPNLTEVLLQASHAARRSAEADLRLMQAVVENARDGILVTDAGTIDPPGPHIVYANPALLNHTGYTLAELVGQNPRIFQGPNTDRASLDLIRTALSRHDPVTAELLNRSKDGTEYWIELSITPLRDASGGVTHFISVQRDVTERKLADLRLRQSERRFQAVFATAHDAILLADDSRRYVDANPAACRMLGYDRADLLGMGLGDISAGDTASDGVTWRTFIEAGQMSGEFTVLRKDRTAVEVEYRAVANILPGLHLSALRDVTERNKATAALVAERAFLRRVIDTVPGFVCVKDARGRFVLANESLAVAYGTAPNRLIGYTDRDFSPTPEQATGYATVEARVLETRQSVVVPVEEIRTASGEARYLKTIKLPLPNGGDDQILAVATDITERVRAEQSLREREERLRFVIEGARLATFDWDMVGDHVVWNDRHYTLFGYAPGEPAEVRLNHFLDRVHPDDRPEVANRLRQATDARQAYVTEHRVVWPDGRVRWCSGYGTCRYDESGKAVRMLGVVQDVTERKEAEIALAERDAVYRLLADQMQDVVALAALDGSLLYISPSCEHLSGYTPAESQANGPQFIVAPDDLPVVRTAWEQSVAGEVATVEWRCRHRDGHLLWMESLLTPVRGSGGAVEQVVTTSRDITARRLAEDRLRQSQKLEAIGQLAGGVAHDFNNLLTVIGGFSEMVLAGLTPGHPHREMLEEVCAAGERGAALTRQLLAFSRQQIIKPEVFDLSVVVRDNCKMLARLIGEDVRLVTEFAERAAWIDADRGQVEQVLMNLVVNARDAMPRGGRLTIRTGAEDVGETYPGRPASCPPGRYVRLSVADTGEGIPPEVLARMFEPFFTTKPTGKGTGLGLATVHGIVGQSRGFITVHSEVGRGTTFDTYFPKQQRASGGGLSGVRPGLPVKGTESVLVVEDEPAVRELTVTVLRMNGYQVTEAETGSEALAAYDKCPVPPALLVTDVVMPDMSGRELAEILVRRQPRLKVLYLSGYTSDAVLRHGVQQEHVEFLQKPYSLASLVRAVRATLDKP